MINISFNSILCHFKALLQVPLASNMLIPEEHLRTNIGREIEKLMLEKLFPCIAFEVLLEKFIHIHFAKNFFYLWEVARYWPSWDALKESHHLDTHIMNEAGLFDTLHQTSRDFLLSPKFKSFRQMLEGVIDHDDISIFLQELPRIYCYFDLKYIKSESIKQFHLIDTQGLLEKLGRIISHVV